MHARPQSKRPYTLAVLHSHGMVFSKSVCTFAPLNLPCSTSVCSADGLYLVSGSSDKSLMLWNADGLSAGPMAVGRGHTDTVLSVVWSPQGAILSAAADRFVRVWDGARRTNGPVEGQRTAAHAAAATAVAWYGNWILSGSRDATLRLWQVNEDHTLSLLASMGHTDAVNSVTWAPDGLRAASGGADAAVCIWDLNGTEALKEGPTFCTYHNAAVRDVAWS